MIPAARPGLARAFLAIRERAIKSLAKVAKERLVQTATMGKTDSVLSV